MEIIRPVRHDKTGKVYLIIQEIIDTTNSANDKLMILYMNLDGMMFVREKSEFWYKFSAIDSSDVIYRDRRHTINQ